MPRIDLGHSVAISEVVDLQQSLLAALAGREPIVLNAGAVVHVDSAGLQVVAAFCESAKGVGVSWTWAEISPAFRSAVRVSGLASTVGLSPSHG
jgi:anti-anti-sigma factor